MATTEELIINLVTKAKDRGIKIMNRGLKTSIGLMNKGKRAAMAMGRAGKMAFKGIGKTAAIGRKALTSFNRIMLAVVAATAAAVRESVKFQTAMAKVNTMVKHTPIRKLSKDVLKLSGDLGIAKDQLAEGLYQALSAGVPEDNAITFLKTAARGAVAGATDVATSVDGLTTVLNAFKIDASEAESVADVLFTTVENGKTTFPELAANLAQVAPLAASTGISIQEVTSAIATLTKQGTPTAQAATQIRSAIIALNENMDDGWAKSMSLQEGLAAIADQAGGSQKKLREIVGRVEAMNGVLGLTGNNAKMAAKDLDAMTQSAGAMSQAFDKMETVKRWPKLWQTILGIVTRIGNVVDQVLAPVVTSITEQLAKWRDADKVFDRMKKKLTEMRELATDIFTAIKEGGKTELINVGLGIGKILLGSLMKGGAWIVQRLLEAAPKIGKYIAREMNPAKKAARKEDIRSAAVDTLHSEGQISDYTAASAKGIVGRHMITPGAKKKIEERMRLVAEQYDKMDAEENTRLSGMSTAEKLLESGKSQVKGVAAVGAISKLKSPEEIEQETTEATSRFELEGVDEETQKAQQKNIRKQTRRWNKMVKRAEKIDRLKAELTGLQSRMQAASGAQKEVGEFRQAETAYQRTAASAPENLSESSFTARSLKRQRETMEKEHAEAEKALKEAGAAWGALSETIKGLSQQISTVKAQIESFEA